MGEVFKAFHPGLDRVAAIKILFKKDMAERFRNEAYIQSSVSHPNIARLYEYIPSKENPCIIMEYVEGDSLDSYLQKKGRIGNDECEKILAQIASALNYLHQKEIIHRDIKPQNFKIERDGTVKMLDFGISKNKYTPKLTQLGFVVGTTEYMAPEQFNNQVDKRSDIWSLGVMAYEMITGHMPFDAVNPISLRSKIIRANFTDPKIFVPQISSRLTTVIDRSLRVNPASRISSVSLVSLLSGKRSRQVRMNKIPTGLNQRLIIISCFLIGVMILVFGLTKPGAPPGPSEPVVKHKGMSTLKGTGKNFLIISVPSIPNAVVVFPDGTKGPVPFEIHGNEGQSVDFIIKAEGYRDKEVKGVQFSPRRSTYQYNLEKLK